VLQFLGGLVVFVVLIPPKTLAHPAAQTIPELLHPPVELDVARHRVVATFMHKPTLAALLDAQKHDPHQNLEVGNPGLGHPRNLKQGFVVAVD